MHEEKYYYSIFRFYLLSLDEWIQRTGNGGVEAAKLVNKQICAEHFLETDFSTTLTGKKRIKPSSYPTDSNGIVSNEQATRNFENILHDSIDENHSVPPEICAVHTDNTDDFCVECCDEEDVIEDEVDIVDVESLKK